MGKSHSALSLPSVKDLADNLQQWYIYAVREFRVTQHGQAVWRAIHTSKDPTIFTMLFEDSAALLGLLVALVGVYLGHQLENPSLDGVASLVIGGILAVVAVLFSL